MMMHDDRFPGLDGLRAVACLFVIFHHVAQRIDIFAQHYVFQHIQLFFLMGNTGVSFFFVLSGFLLSYPFWKNYLTDSPFPNLKRYAYRRTARIVPGYYASLFAGTLMAFLFVPDMPHFGKRIVAGLTFTSGFHYVTLFPSVLNSPLWSISFEVFCYLLMPVFMFILFRLPGDERSFKKAMYYWIGVFLVVLGINQSIHIFFATDNVKTGWEFGITGGSKHWMPNYNPVGFFGHFVLGIFAAGISCHIKGNVTQRATRWNVFDGIALVSVVGIVALLGYVSTKEEFTHSLQHQPYFFPYLTALIATLMIGLVHSNQSGKILDNRFMRFTGKISFGLYIWHYLIIQFISKYVLEDYANYMAIKDWRLGLGASALMMALAYAVATLSYSFLEKPFIEKARRKTYRGFYKERPKISIRGVLSMTLLLFLSLVFLFPLIWLLDASFRPPLEILQSPPVILSQPIWESFESYTRDSYLASFWHYNVGRALFNSIVVTGGTLLLTGIISSLYAYALVFMNFKYKRFFFVLAISTMMIPLSALIVPFYKVLKDINLLNNWLGLILPGSISGFGVFLIRQYLLKIPQTVIEAAKIDGAGHFQIWWHIILPILRPALAALAIIQFRIVWNDFLYPIIIMRDDSMQTLPVKILFIDNAGAVLATGFISIAIPLLLFVKFHRQFTEGLIDGVHR